jgi:4-hydroxy-tetrahydrodipicolinate synthase
MIHEMPMRNGLGPGTVQYSLSVLDELLALPNVTGLKEESLDPVYGKQVVDRTASKGIVIGAGGGMSRYLRDHWSGARTFLGGVGNFIPELELRFFERMEEGKHYEAARIVYELEQPFFKVAGPIGWHPSLKCAMSIKGLLPPYERPPLKAPGGKDKEAIRGYMEKMKWL